jgi:hypothetical protein
LYKNSLKKYIRVTQKQANKPINITQNIKQGQYKSSRPDRDGFLVCPSRMAMAIPRKKQLGH